MATHYCETCNGEAKNACSRCQQAFYCGTECQRQDYAEHCQDCKHVSEMTAAELRAEIEAHLELDKEHAHLSAELAQSGQELVQLGDPIEQRQWVSEVVAHNLIGLNDRKGRPVGQKKGGFGNAVKRAFSKRKIKKGQKAYKKTLK